MTRGAKDGNDGLLRLLAHRGLPDDQSLRAKVWKALLGYLPMKRHDEWNAIYGEKRALYASYRSELLTVSSSQEVSLNVASKSPGSEIDDQDLLQEIKNDVERTRRDFEYFRRPATKAALTALLFVYAKLNPGVRYVQGMNEIAAVLLYVMSVETDAETDAFWCFSEMMAEIKDGFMQALDHSGEGVYGMVEEISQMLRSESPRISTVGNREVLGKICSRALSSPQGSKRNGLAHVRFGSGCGDGASVVLSSDFSLQ
ncbi:Tbc1d13 [Symbiodinium sp. CCMP2456]|nr:Tbc1d13 [Symbiodinium sp. CCMP2456]